MEKTLCDAAFEGRADKVFSLLRENPEIDVNWANTSSKWTALHVTSRSGHAEVVKLLLAHPGINVNVQDSNRFTPLVFGCVYGRVSVVKLLLKDPRVDVVVSDMMGCPPLWWAAAEGHLEVIEWFLASGRDFDVNQAGRDWKNGVRSTPIQVATQKELEDGVTLLKRFTANPAMTRHELRVRLVPEELAAELFALTVFLCDDLLCLKTPTKVTTATATAASRFFDVVKRLPMELQMVLCRRVFRSAKDSVLSKDSEVAFKSLAKILTNSK